VVSTTTTRSFPHWRLSGRATASAEPWPERGPARLRAEPDAHWRAALRGAPRSARGRWRGNPASPDLSKPNCQDYQESRLGTENREPPETLGRILDSPGLSKTADLEKTKARIRAKVEHPFRVMVGLDFQNLKRGDSGRGEGTYLLQQQTCPHLGHVHEIRQDGIPRGGLAQALAQPKPQAKRLGQSCQGQCKAGSPACPHQPYSAGCAAQAHDRSHASRAGSTPSYGRVT